MKFLRNLLSWPFIALKFIWGILMILAPLLQKLGILFLIISLLGELPSILDILEGGEGVFGRLDKESQFNYVMGYVVFAGLPILSPLIFRLFSAINDKILEWILTGGKRKTAYDRPDSHPGSSGLTREQFIRMVNESQKTRQVNLASLSDDEIRRLTENFTSEDWNQFTENLSEDEFRRLAKIFNQV